MNKFLLTSTSGFILAIGISIFNPLWADSFIPNDSIMPCDKVRINNNPCTADLESRETPAPTKITTIIHQEKLSKHRSNESSASKTNTRLQNNSPPD